MFGFFRDDVSDRIGVNGIHVKSVFFFTFSLKLRIGSFQVVFFAEDGKEMYQNVQHTCRVSFVLDAIVVVAA